MRWLVVILGCVACGRIGFDTLDGDASASVDAPLPTGPFGPPMLIGELDSTSDDDDISLTGDLLEIYFMSGRTGSGALHRATRATATDAWSTPTEVTGLSSDLNNPRISNDGLTIYFTSSLTPNAGMRDLWFASRPDRSSPWGPAEPLPGINTAENELEPWMLDSRLVLYFTISALGIVRAERGSTSELFGPPVVVDALVASGYQGTVWVDESETLVLFHSDTTPDREIWYSTRASAADAWAAPLRLTELNSASSDADPWMSPDRHVVFFVSDRSSSGYDIYMATR